MAMIQNLMSTDQKQTIILVADVRSWAFDSIAQYVKDLIKEKYNCHIVYTSDFDDHKMFFVSLLEEYDEISLIHFFWRGYLSDLLKKIGQQNYYNKYSNLVEKFLKIAVTTGIPDHLLIKNNNEILDYLPLFKFIDNCYSVSTKLQNIYNGIKLYPNSSRVIYDNLLIKEQTPNFSSNEKLVISWVGNSLWGEATLGFGYDSKGFVSVIKPTLAEIKNEIDVEIFVMDGAISKTPKQDVYKILEKTDILLIGAKTDGTPLPLIEAMANGCAIISTDVGIVPEVLPSIQHPFIIEGNSKEFVNAIKILNSNRELLSEIKKQNFDNYKRIFCNKACFENLWDSFIQESISASSNLEKKDFKRAVLKTFKTANMKKHYYSFRNLVRFVLRKCYSMPISRYLLQSQWVKIFIIRPILALVKKATIKESCDKLKEYLMRYKILDKKDNVLVIYTDFFPGVSNSTSQLFNHAVSLPSVGLSIYTGLPDSIIYELAKAIVDSGIKNLIISGGLPAEIQLIEKVRQLDNNIDVYYIWHGSPAQWCDAHHFDNFSNFLRLYRENKIQAVVSLKKDLEKILKSYGIKSYLLQNFIPTQQTRFISFTKDKFKIGLWSAYSIWIKNLYPQLIAIGMMKDSILYTNFSFSAKDHWIMKDIECRNYKGHLPNRRLLDIMAGTDLTLYITNTECSPMVVLESLSVGVPCIVGPTSGVYDDNVFLKEMLTVNRVDCSMSIYNAIERVRQNMDEIKLQLPGFIEQYNRRAEHLKSFFIESINQQKNDSKS